MPTRLHLKQLTLFTKLVSFIRQTLPIISVLLFILFTSGFTYSLVESPIWFYPVGSSLSFVMPYLDFQTVIEFIVVLISILGGLIGLSLIMRGNKVMYGSKYANMLLLIGSFLFVISFLFLQYLLAVKLGWI